MAMIVKPAVPMTQKAQNAAKSLAIAYAAYCEARAKHDAASAAVWGRLLIESQDKCGVVLFTPETINP